MSELLHDEKFTNIELTSELGINFSGENSRIKHTGSGIFSILSSIGKIKIEATSNILDDAIKINSVAGGIDMDAAQLISIETSDITDGIKIGTTAGVPIEFSSEDTNSTFNGNVIISGNLTVLGDTVSHEVTTVVTEDPVLKLADGGAGNLDIGFVGERGESTNIGFIWDESADEFACVFISDDAQLDLVSTPQNIDFSNSYAPLHIGNTTTTSTALTVGTDGAGSDALFYSGTAGDNMLWDASAVKLVITGTASQDALHVASGNVNIDGDFDLDGANFDVTVSNDITTSSVQGVTMTNTGDVTGFTLNQTGNATVLDVQQNGSSAIIVESDRTVGINMSNPNNSYALDVNGIMNATSVFQANALLVPTGAIMPYAGSSAPTGWLQCTGANISRTTYAALFSVIGTTYGVGDGSTTFTLPNLRGRTIIGYNSSDGDFNTIGNTGGSKTKTLDTTEIPSHTHSGTTNSDGTHTHTVNISDPGHNHTYGMGKDDGNLSNSNGQVPPGDADSPDYSVNTSSSTTGITASTVSSGSHTHTFTTGATGGGNAFSLLNPYCILYYVIKY